MRQTIFTFISEIFYKKTEKPIIKGYYTMDMENTWLARSQSSLWIGMYRYVDAGWLVFMEHKRNLLAQEWEMKRYRHARLYGRYFP